MSKFAIGDVLDVSEVFAIYNVAIVEDVYTKKNGLIYMKVRGVRNDGSLYKNQNNLWEDAYGIKKIR